ncbi:MAPEG family protein [Xanthomonas phaseoli]|uniref:MAPEG family protein n=1 Tax=Xanthomonas phaseoli TaxID=1985254 RepID=UPI003B00F6C2
MVHLDRKQRGVVLGMASGLLASLFVVFLASRAFLSWDAPERAGTGLLLPAAAMFLAIARMAKHRFVTPADIDGSALSVGTARARTLQSLLQNTTEQLAFALPVYVAALLSTRPAIQAAVPACACAFLLGRLIFFATYSGGAGARALGFALTFYPTVLLLSWQLVLLAVSVAG